MDSEASQVSAVSQVPTGSAQPAAATSDELKSHEFNFAATSRLQAKPERTTEHARAVHQLKSPDSKEAGMRRPFVTRGNSKDKPLSKLERKMDSDASQVAAVSRVPTGFARPAATNSGRSICQPELEDRKRGLRRLFQTKLNINGKSDPKLGNKVNMDLDENSRPVMNHDLDTLGKVKKSKTKMDTTKDDERVPLPRAKLHMVYLTGDPIEDDEAASAYHKNFLENVFGSRASEIFIAYSCTGRVNSFIVWLTDEEVAILARGREDCEEDVGDTGAGIGEEGTEEDAKSVQVSKEGGRDTDTGMKISSNTIRGTENLDRVEEEQD
ncbi:hypothetical protein RHSIM_RhsimUnG0154500 [Rhododendron simsii]|uniref:Uncharacterized protein n=1 Tax=Rhododendron simsii TaxID=118357 RepID=A0A834L4I3_RHOSS|nr:hypothetical protein RHSIM_RhsimUnG0154500 [Rhododendron simsii]